MQKRLDPFGVLIIAFVTSVGGGTVRDLLLDVPVFAATGRHLSIRYVFQVDGRAVVSERIVEIR